MIDGWELSIKHCLFALTFVWLQQQCMVPKMFNIRLHLLKSIVHVIMFMANRNFFFFCIH